MILRKFKSSNWKYAIGEVLLIVIGILIALQIDNWNEAAKERTFEVKILKEIRKSLETDLKHFDSRMDRLDEMEDSYNIMLNYFRNTPTYHDSLSSHLNRISWTLVFEPRTAAFETLKAKGLDIIRYDSLRISLTNIYDFEYPRIQYMVDTDINSFVRFELRPLIFEYFYLTDEIDSSEQHRDEFLHPLNYSHLREDLKFKSHIISKRARVRSVHSRFRRMNRMVQDLISHIDDELH